MTRDPIDERIRELSWRERRSAEEEAELKAWLSNHPESRDKLSAETELSRALGQMPDAPMPSNFTARVLQEAMRPARKPQSRWAWLWHARWLPRAAVASVLLGAAMLSYHHVQENRRVEIARSVALVSDSRTLPNPDVLENFDAIAALSPDSASADEQLLALFK